MRPSLKNAPRTVLLEHEPALLGDPDTRCVVRNDDEVDPMLLLRREQVVDEQLHCLCRVAVARVPVTVELVRQLERVPVADRREELDVSDYLVVLVPDQERPLAPLPEAVLREPAA